MKNHPFFLSLTALLLLAALSTEAQTPAPVRVACVGDSITHGSGAQPRDAYPAQLQNLLGATYDVKNFGLSGRTLLKMGDHPYWKETAFQNAQSFQPNIVVIMLGTNDTKPQNWVHFDQFAADYKELIETFKKLASQPKIYICRPNPVFGAGKYGITETNLDQEMPVIDKLAADEGVSIIDMHAALEGHPELEPDTVHPNQAGYLIMAQTVARALTGKAP